YDLCLYPLPYTIGAEQTCFTASINSLDLNGLLRNASTFVEGSTIWASFMSILNAVIKITFISGRNSFTRLTNSKPDMPDIRMSDKTSLHSLQPSSTWESAAIGFEKP